MTDKYHQNEASISAGEIYLTICVEWADDHIGLGLT